MWENVGWITGRLFTRCTRHRYSKDEKKCFIYTDYCVWCFTKPMHAFLLSSPFLSFSLCVSCTFLDHQQGLAWGSSSWVSFSRTTSKGANHELQTKLREGLCGMSHTTSIHSSWGHLGHWAMFWEHHKSLSFSRASWESYPNPTVVAAFVSLTKGPALYTCQGANESNKQGPWKRGGQASAVLLSFTGFLAAALPWKLGNPQSASLMSDDDLALMEILEKKNTLAIRNNMLLGLCGH